MSDQWRVVRKYDVLSLMPANGTRAAWDAGGHVEVSPLVAVAVCRVTETIYDTSKEGAPAVEAERYRQVCGIDATDGLTVCEECTNLLGYIAPGEPEDKWGKPGGPVRK